MSAELQAEIALWVVKRASSEKVMLVGRLRTRRSLTLAVVERGFLRPSGERVLLIIDKDVGHHRKEQRRVGEGELGGRSGHHLGGGSADGFGPSS